MKHREAFTGIKVMDFSWAGAGPQASRVLAEHGATVIRVESHRSPDALRSIGPFVEGKPGLDRSAFGVAYHTNKYGITLDVTTSKGREIAEKLILWSDVVTESFTPGTMKKWGLDYESVVRFKPDVIYFSTSQQGQSGRHSQFSGYGPHAASLAGFFEVTGWPDRGPTMVYGAYTDFISPWYLAIAVIAALDRKRKTGRGAYLEQSQLEAGISFLGPAVLDYFVNGRIATRMGNRDPHTAPHGAFHCKGDDRWVAIAVRTDEQWKAFCEAVGNPAWTRDPKFSTLKGRKENEDALEKEIEQWTMKRTPGEIMSGMQAAGVPAGVVQNSKDLFEDPQLKHRRGYEFLHHKVMGLRSYNTPAFRLSKSPWQPKKAPAAMGEDNEWVYKEILGFSDGEIAGLISEGVITTEPGVP